MYDMTTTRETAVGVYSEEFFLRCSLFSLRVSDCLEYFWWGLFFLCLFGCETGSIGVNGHNLLYHVHRLGLNGGFYHESIGTSEFIAFEEHEGIAFLLQGWAVFALSRLFWNQDTLSSPAASSLTHITISHDARCDACI